MAYLYYTSCLRYTILVWNPRTAIAHSCTDQRISGMVIGPSDLFVGWLLNVPATGECISGTGE